MRKLLALLTFCLLINSVLTAACREGGPVVCGPCYLEDWPSPVNVNVSGGYRRDNFRWSIAGLDHHPNVLSELKWQNLRMGYAEATASYVSCRNYVVRANADYGWILHGRNSDADYLFNNKKGLFSLSHSEAGRGYVYDVNGAVGYRALSTRARFTATPLVGYSFHSQHLHMYHGTRIFVIDDVEVRVPLPGLHNIYHTRWFGPWGGMEFEARVESCAYVYGSFEWHMLSYRAKGHWNLRRDIGVFQHKANGFGYIAKLGGKWEILKNFAIGVQGSYRLFQTRKGHAATPIHIAGFPDIVAETRFNGAHWKAYTLEGCIAWRF